MTNKEKLNLLEEMLDSGETLTDDMVLSDVENWDSMAFISFIALVDEKFGKQVAAPTVKAAKTVDDLLKLME